MDDNMPFHSDGKTDTCVECGKEAKDHIGKECPKEDLIDKIEQEGGFDSDFDAAFLRTLPPDAAFLVYQEAAFIGCDHQHEWPAGVENPCQGQPHSKVLALLLSDTFGYACADAENVRPDQCAEVASIYRKYGYLGLVCWAAKQRNMGPVIEYTEDPQYQKTWIALYGDLKLQPNACNESDPRWSSEKLDLEPWDPKEMKP